MERTVTVWGKPHAVKVSQSARASFMASGEVQGQMIFARGATAAAALAAWATNAKSRTPRRA